MAFVCGVELVLWLCDGCLLGVSCWFSDGSCALCVMCCALRSVWCGMCYVAARCVVWCVCCVCVLQVAICMVVFVAYYRALVACLLENEMTTNADIILPFIVCCVPHVFLYSLLMIFTQ